ncbi:Fic family protein [Candidatus Woesearchaeota archaeon]|nr:Fic family protein [Candidatus Woesearchaeota archaeon]
MTFISVKTIKGKKRRYLERSFRLPDGRVRKLSVYLGGAVRERSFPDESRKRLDSKVREAYLDFASGRYRKVGVFTNALIRRLEEMRLAYADMKRGLTRSQMQDVIDRFTVNFTYESNALEGNSLTLKDVSMVFQEGRVAGEKELREVYETINTRKAMRLLFSGKLRMRERDIIRLHRILVERTGVPPGYKRFPNFLLHRTVRTTPPESVAHEMGSLLDWYRTSTEMHPLKRAAAFHARFERIHPFEDGNGRMGRLLVNIILIENGFPPLIIRKTQRLSYLATLEAFDKGHSTKLDRFFVERYKETYRRFFLVYVRYL